MVIRRYLFSILFFSLLTTVIFPGIREATADLSHGPQRVKMLRQAVDADPTNPLGWIDLAEILRSMGYRTEATAALDSALVWVKQKSGQEKKQFATEYLIARAWLDYEQAEWADGQARAERAAKFGGGQRAHLIAALNRTASKISDEEMRESLIVFFPTDSNTNRGRNWSWSYRLWRHFHHVPYTPIDAPGYKPDSFKFPDHEVLRWRDRGLIEEANNQATLSLQAYAKSAEYHPVGEGDWMIRLEREVPGAKSGFPPMPFWVNRDDGYVTGSLLAYQGYCHDRMKAETDPNLRAAWANRVVWAGKAAIHRYPYRPWTRLWRGEAFLELDMFKEAENDITYARSWFEEFGIDEPALNPVDGHIYLLEKNYGHALPMLEQAAVDFPNDASVWADLGLVRIKRKGRDPAREAFDRALELDPSLGVVWHNRGMLNIQDNRFPEALTDLETAAELAPHDPQVTADLARIKQIIKYKGQ